MRLPVPTVFNQTSMHRRPGPRALPVLWLVFGLVLVSGLCACDRAEDARTAVGNAASSASDKLHSVATPGPATILDRMLTRARSGDWAGYVEFYGEADKLRSDADRQALIHRFQNDWGRRVIANLERADAVKPVIEGDRAFFRDDRGDAFVLYRGADGEWGFHL